MNGPGNYNTERVTRRKVRGPHMEDISCKCQRLSFWRFIYSSNEFSLLWSVVRTVIKDGQIRIPSNMNLGGGGGILRKYCFLKHVSKFSIVYSFWHTWITSYAHGVSTSWNRLHNIHYLSKFAVHIYPLTFHSFDLWVKAPVCTLLSCGFSERHIFWSLHPTPVLLPGKSHGWRSLVGCSPWSR